MYIIVYTFISVLAAVFIKMTSIFDIPIIIVSKFVDFMYKQKNNTKFKMLVTTINLLGQAITNMKLNLNQNVFFFFNGFHGRLIRM